MTDVYFNLFVYGTLKRGERNASLLDGCEWLGKGTVGGILYAVDGNHTALVLYDSAPVPGEVWRCPADMLPRLDAFESVDDGLYRRVGVNVQMLDSQEAVGCWAYVAGPRLAHRLSPAHRLQVWSTGA